MVQDGLGMMSSSAGQAAQPHAPRTEHYVREGSRPGVAGTRADPALPRLEYCDEAVRDPSQAPPVDVHQPPAFLHKLLQLAGVRLLFEELPLQVSKSLAATPPNPYLPPSL